VAAGERRLVDHEQRVGVVAIVGKGVGDEAVVEVVEDRRRQDAIEPEDAGLGIPLVLVAAAARDLDDDLDLIGEPGPPGRPLPLRHPRTIPKRRNLPRRPSRRRHSL